MRKLITLLAPLALLLILAAPALAQSGGLIYRDEAGQLDRSRVQAAAQPLIDRGARVAVYAVNGGNEQDFLDRLERDSLKSGSSVNAGLVAIYVSFSPRYSEIRYGDKWNEALRTNNNSGAIRSNELNPKLAAGDPTGAFVNSLGAIDKAIASPPTTGVGTTVNVGSGTFLPIVLGIIFLVVLFIGGPTAWTIIKKRRVAQQALQAAKQAFEDARHTAGWAIADMGQELQVAREKAQFDQYSYAAADVQQLSQWQSAAENQFVEAQEQFKQATDELIAKQTPTQADYDNGAQKLVAAAEVVQHARQQLAQADARRTELDQLNQAAPGEVDRAKKALADAAERLDALGEDFAQPEAILRPAQTQLERAESLLAEHRAADAISTAGTASATATELDATLARYADIREGISAGRAGAEKAAAQGYQVEAGMASFATSEGLLRQVSSAIAMVGPGAVASLLDQAEAARADGVARGGGLPVLRRQNDERMTQIRESGEQLAVYITEGRKTFDIVDEFAESAWSDIRGNGSEAQAAAERAQAFWNRAVGRNTMETQEFQAAAEDLTAAENQIGYARLLIDSIMQRLKDLLAARDAARDEITVARNDVEKGWAFVHSNDPDIGKAPDQALERAGTLLVDADAEIGQPKPDWLKIVRLAQEANALADDALARARSEVEAMSKLREQVVRARQLATAEVQKIVQFSALHAEDLPKSSLKKIDALRNDVEAAYKALQEAERSEDDARTADLREALEYYKALQTESESLYNEIYAAFQQVESMREQVTAEVYQAEQAIQRAENVQRMAAGYFTANSEGVKQLDQARWLLDSISKVRTDLQMRGAIDTARSARSTAEQAESLFRAEIASRQQIHTNSNAGDFIAGAVIGSLLSGGNHHNSHSGGWGSGGSSSGSSSGGSDWGSGSSSGGGDWGGGGSSGGGDWGGGGSSGGGEW